MEGRNDEARLAAEAVQGRTRLTTAYATSPLKVLTPATHTSAAHAVLTNFGGGFVSGDQIRLSVTCGEGARLCVGTQANTRVYRARGEAWSGQTVTGQVGPAALVAVLQDPLVLHDGARFRQIQTWQVAAGGSLLLTDWLCTGRHESGERFAFAGYRGEIRLETPAGPLLLDRLSLVPDEDREHGVEPFGPFDHLFTAYLYGPVLTGLFAEMARLTVRDRPPEPGQPVVTWHLLSEQCGILRAMGATRSQLQGILLLLGKLLANPEILGFDPVARKT